MMSNVSYRSLLTVAAAAVTLGLCVGTAHAGNERRIRKDCGEDFHRLCPREKRDSPALRYCVEAKGNYLTKRCIRTLEDEGEIPRGYFNK